MQDVESVDVPVDLPNKCAGHRTIPDLDADDANVEKAARGEIAAYAPDVPFKMLEVGEIVRVKAKLTSHNAGHNMILRSGEVGQVIEIDPEGDAKIYFGGYGVHWIWRDDWHKLSTTSFAGKSDLFAAKPSFHQLYQLQEKLSTGVSGQMYKVVSVPDGKAAEPYQGATGDSASQNGCLCAKITDLSTSATMGFRFRTRRSASKESTDGANQEEVCLLMQEKLEYEVGLLRKLGREDEAGGEHCLRLVDHFLESGVAYTVLDGMGTMSLLEALEAYSVLTERELAQMFMQMLQAIAYLDKCRVVHRDIQPGRFTCGSATESSGATLRLCDFTFAAEMPEDGSKLKQICGTPPFMSPEMLLRTGYDSCTDVWSFGVMAYTLMLGHFPYSSADKSGMSVRQSIADGGKLPSFQPSQPLNRSLVGSGVKTFLQRLLFREAFGRYTPQKALEDDWLSVSVALGSEGAESLPSMLPSLKLAKRAGLGSLERKAAKLAGLTEADVAKAGQQAAGAKSRLNKLLVTKQRKHHGAQPDEDDGCGSTTTGSSETYESDFMIHEVTSLN